MSAENLPTTCQNPDIAEYGYDFNANQLVVTLRYDDPTQYADVYQWEIKWGNNPDIIRFDPSVSGTEAGSYIVNGPITPDTSGNYVIRLNIPYSEIYLSGGTSGSTLNYSFHIQTTCHSGTSDWSLIQNDFKYITGFECMSESTVKINFGTLTQPISKFRIIYGPKGFDPSLAESALNAIGAYIVETAFPPPVEGPQYMFVYGLQGIVYDFYIQRIENVGTGNESIWGYNLIPYTFDIKGCAGTNPPLCQPLTAIQITNIAGTQIQLDWLDSNSPATVWQLEYGLQGFTQGTGTIINGITSPTYTLTGLLEFTAYDVYITANCNDFGLSDATQVSFTTTAQQCAIPLNLQASPTDTSVYLSWEDGDTTQEPGAWEVTYALSNYDPNTDQLATQITTYAPEITIEDLIPSNAYDFWVRSVCSYGNSDWVLVHVDTPCTSCSSFTPQIGKEYVISAWVKENWDTRPTVTMNPPVNKIKEMLNDLVLLYNTNYNTDNPICPNGTQITAVNEMITANLFHEELIQTIDGISGQTAPRIYNFQYYTKENKSEFRFQFTKGEHHWSDNLLKNPGAELGTDNWSGRIFSSLSVNERCGAGTPNTKDGNTGSRFFWMGINCGVNYGSSLQIYQDVDVSEYLIDNGDSTVEISGYMKGHDNERNVGDTQKIQLIFIDSSGELVGITDPSSDNMFNDVGVNASAQVWYKYTHEYPIPPKTRTIRVKLIGENGVPNNENDSFFDDLSLKVNYPTFDDLSPVQSFDVDCYNNGIYEHNTVTTVTDPAHYPFSNYYYNLQYTCNANSIDSKYKYGKNVYTSTASTVTIGQQVYTYNKTYLELTFLNNQDEIIPDFTGVSNRRYYPSGNIIDEWQRIQGTFKAPIGTVKVKIALVNKHISDAFFDDVRVFPAEGNMKSFVYDQITQKLMAELDENNYATFYEYDKEGGLIRVKKETEKGIFTIQETRSGNVKK